ncbi:hypothetical protein AAHB37_08345 [Glutamicibacter halophytocola]|uniref:hypothetical protein n=1 Tax=Glutamicibacter halophytocola TaxID=1933880 RepID=UPI0032191C35
MLLGARAGHHLQVDASVHERTLQHLPGFIAGHLGKELGGNIQRTQVQCLARRGAADGAPCAAREELLGAGFGQAVELNQLIPAGWTTDKHLGLLAHALIQSPSLR